VKHGRPEKAGLPSVFGRIAERREDGYNRLFEANGNSSAELWILPFLKCARGACIYERPKCKMKLDGLRAKPALDYLPEVPCADDVTDARAVVDDGH
jgi:hypothetical protein